MLAHDQTATWPPEALLAIESGDSASLLPHKPPNVDRFAIPARGRAFALLSPERASGLILTSGAPRRRSCADASWQRAGFGQCRGQGGQADAGGSAGQKTTAPWHHPAQFLAAEPGFRARLGAVE